MKNNIIEQFIHNFNLNTENVRVGQINKKDEILTYYRDFSEYISCLNYHLIEKSGNNGFSKFYDAYEKIFKNEEERESFNGFEEVLDFNLSTILQKKYGPFKEVIIYCTDPQDNKIIGGINFSTYSIPFEINNIKVFGTSHIFYLFVNPEYRSLKLAAELIKKARSYSELLIKDWNGINESATFEKNQIIVFCEQNYPEKMTVYQYWLDNLYSVTDQFDRLGWWNKMGFRRLSFDYIQPSLNSSSRPCTYLSLNANLDNAENLPSELIIEHIRRFFSISVLKGIDHKNDISYKAIEKQLKINPYISFENFIDFGSSKKKIFDHSYTDTQPDVLIGELLANN